MAEDSGFRVDRLGTIDIRTGKRVDHLVTILDYPWIAIWMSPRETIKKIVDRDPHNQVIMLGALAGSLTLLNFFLSAALGFLPTPPPKVLIPYLPILTLLSPFLGGILGIGGLYLGALAMDWAGRALGGVGNAVTVRAAIAWSMVPEICFSIAMLIILLGSGVWQVVYPVLPDPNAGVPVSTAAAQLTPIRGIELMLSIWSFVLMLHCVGQVHRFSAWKALLAFLLPGSIIAGIAILMTIA